MITSSSKCIIKYGNGIEIEQFTLPVQIPPPPGQESPGKRGEKASDGKLNTEQDEAENSPHSENHADDVEEEARQLLLKAERTASDIIRKAGAQAEKIKEAASSDGFQEGYERGIREGLKKAEEEQEKFLRQQSEEFRQDMERALAAVDREKEVCFRSYLDELKDCTVAIAEKVIHISLKSSGEIIKKMIIAETEKMKKRAWVKIYMEKSDYDMMVEADADVVGELAKLSDNIKFVVMDKENSGSCIIEMPDEIVDISVDTQMENIREILENIRF